MNVAITFDAEYADRTNHSDFNIARILDTLAGADALATFFVQGRWVRSQPDLGRAIVEGGHLIGNHSNFHVRMSLLSDMGINVDILDGGIAITEMLGVAPAPWFRLPFGDGHDDPRVLAAITEMGYREVFWDVAVEDWEPARQPEQIADDAVNGLLRVGEGAVLLLHTWPNNTALALPKILHHLTDAGATFVRIDDLERSDTVA